MALNLKKKKEIIAEVNGKARDALSLVIAQPVGISAPAMATLRKEALEKGVCLRMIRNTLATRALEGTSYECLGSALTGSTLLAFSTEHPGSAARLLKHFAKDNESFSIKAAAFEGEITDAQVLAKIPTYKEGIMRLVTCMREASIGRFMSTLAAIREQKQEKKS